MLTLCLGKSGCFDAEPDATEPEKTLGVVERLCSFQPWLDCGSSPVLVEPHAGGLPRVVRSAGVPSRTLRGDFEPPETLLVTFDRDWVEAVTQIAKAAAGQATVGLLVKPADMTSYADSELANARHVEVMKTEFDSPWIRDYGPVQSRDEWGMLWLDFDYTWTRPADDRIPRWLALAMGARLEASDAVFDGGAAISNGAGLCAVGTGALDESGFRGGPERQLAAFLGQLGCRVTAVLPPVPGERTGHADMIAQFLSREHVVVAALDPAGASEAAARLDEAADILTEAASSLGLALRVTRVPIVVEGERFYSYVNVTRLRSKLLVPHYEAVDTALEQAAYRTIARVARGSDLVPIPADKLIQHGGAVHCATLGLSPLGPQKRVRLARRRPDHG